MSRKQEEKGKDMYALAWNEQLDWHFRLQHTMIRDLTRQNRGNKGVHLSGKWQGIFLRTSKEEKLARNYLAGLMITQLKESGTLGYPFNERENYNRGLRQVLLDYETRREQPPLSVGGRATARNDEAKAAAQAANEASLVPIPESSHAILLKEPSFKGLPMTEEMIRKLDRQEQKYDQTTWHNRFSSNNKQAEQSREAKRAAKENAAQKLLKEAPVVSRRAQRDSKERQRKQQLIDKRRELEEQRRVQREREKQRLRQVEIQERILKERQLLEERRQAKKEQYEQMIKVQMRSEHERLQREKRRNELGQSRSPERVRAGKERRVPQSNKEKPERRETRQEKQETKRRQEATPQYELKKAKFKSTKREVEERHKRLAEKKQSIEVGQMKEREAIAQKERELGAALEKEKKLKKMQRQEEAKRAERKHKRDLEEERKLREEERYNRYLALMEEQRQKEREESRKNLEIQQRHEERMKEERAGDAKKRGKTDPEPVAPTNIEAQRTQKITETYQAYFEKELARIRETKRKQREEEVSKEVEKTKEPDEVKKQEKDKEKRKRLMQKLSKEWKMAQSKWLRQKLEERKTWEEMENLLLGSGDEPAPSVTAGRENTEEKKGGEFLQMLRNMRQRSEVEKDEEKRKSERNERIERLKERNLMQIRKQRERLDQEIQNYRDAKEQEKQQRRQEEETRAKEENEKGKETLKPKQREEVGRKSSKKEEHKAEAAKKAQAEPRPELCLREIMKSVHAEQKQRELNKQMQNPKGEKEKTPKESKEKVEHKSRLRGGKDREKAQVQTQQVQVPEDQGEDDDEDSGQAQDVPDTNSPIPSTPPTPSPRVSPLLSPFSFSADASCVQSKWKLVWSPLLHRYIKIDPAELENKLSSDTELRDQLMQHLRQQLEEASMPRTNSQEYFQVQPLPSRRDRWRRFAEPEANEAEDGYSSPKEEQPQEMDASSQPDSVRGRKRKKEKVKEQITRGTQTSPVAASRTPPASDSCTTVATQAASVRDASTLAAQLEPDVFEDLLRGTNRCWSQHQTPPQLLQQKLQAMNLLLRQKLEEVQLHETEAKRLLQLLLKSADKVVQRLRQGVPDAVATEDAGAVTPRSAAQPCRIFGTLFQPLLHLMSEPELQQIDQLDGELEAQLSSRYGALEDRDLQSELATLPAHWLHRRRSEYDVGHRRRLALHCFHLLRQLFEERCSESEGIWLMALQTIERLYFDQLRAPRRPPQQQEHEQQPQPK